MSDEVVVQVVAPKKKRRKKAKRAKRVAAVVAVVPSPSFGSGGPMSGAFSERGAAHVAAERSPHSK
jgi:hypothetical protein